VNELDRMMKVRAAALERFGEANIRQGAVMATLEDVLVPLYFSHRYQVEAAVKLIGGVDYRYALRGDGQLTTAMVPPAEQRRALDAVLRTLSPAELTIEERLLRLIPPRPAGLGRTRELLEGRTGPVLDAAAAAESAAGMVLALLLDPARAARLAQQAARAPGALSFPELSEKLYAATFGRRAAGGLEGLTANAVRLAALRQLMALASENAEAYDAVRSWKQKLQQAPASAHTRFALAQIERFEKDPKTVTLPKIAEAPPGMPIGTLLEGFDCGWPD